MALTRITPTQVQDRLTAESDLTFIDVRSVREFEGGHVPGAVNIPLMNHHPVFGQMVPNKRFMEAIEANFAKDAKLVTGCAVGGRSMRAAQALEGAGYTAVVDMIGGFSGRKMPPEPGWTDAGLPVSSNGRTWADVAADLDS